MINPEGRTIKVTPDGGIAVAATSSDTISTGNNVYHTFQITKLGTAGVFSVQVQGSLDGVNWYQLTTVSSSGFSTVTGAYSYMRVHVASLTASDTIEAYYRGR